MCRRYRGMLSCAVRASGGGAQSHVSCVRVGSVPSLGGGQKDKNIKKFPSPPFFFFHAAARATPREATGGGRAEPVRDVTDTVT